MNLMAPVFNQALKAGHVGFVTDIYRYIQCISSSLYSLTNILAEDLGVCSTMVYATKGAPSKCQQHWPEYGGRDLQFYTVLQIVTLPMCRCVSTTERLFLSN